MHNHEKEYKTMTQEQMTTALLESTVKVVAVDGLDKTTTKSIAKGANLNEVYIYRNFSNKEDLLVKTFELLDNELVQACLTHLPVMEKSEIDFRVRCRILFDGVWQFILGDRDRCKYFIQYFYSPYFKKFSAQNHKIRFESVVELIKPAFKDGIDVWLLLNHILNIIFDFALKIFDGEIDDDAETADLVFNLIFTSVFPYFAKK